MVGVFFNGNNKRSCFNTFLIKKLQTSSNCNSRLSFPSRWDGSAVPIREKVYTNCLMSHGRQALFSKLATFGAVAHFVKFIFNAISLPETSPLAFRRFASMKLLFLILNL